MLIYMCQTPYYVNVLYTTYQSILFIINEYGYQKTFVHPINLKNISVTCFLLHINYIILNIIYETILVKFIQINV